MIKKCVSSSKHITSENRLQFGTRRLIDTCTLLKHTSDFPALERSADPPLWSPASFPEIKQSFQSIAKLDAKEYKSKTWKNRTHPQVVTQEPKRIEVHRSADL